MYILFDIGGTKTRVARSEDLKTFIEPIKYDTPSTYEEGIAALRRVIAELADDDEVAALAGGIRGILDHERTMLEKDLGGVLSDWEHKSLVEDLSTTFKAPVYIENDTATVGLGEAVFGAGKGYGIVAYHTVSTGVGGVKIEHGRIDEASHGFEPGHQVLDIDHSVFGADAAHTLESLVSGSALEARRGVKPYEIPQDDPVWDELAGYLAKGLKNTIAYWSPDVIVLGGSMIVGDPRIFLEDIVRHTKEEVGDKLPCPNIVDATLKDEGGLYGAMALLSQKSEMNGR